MPYSVKIGKLYVKHTMGSPSNYSIPIATSKKLAKKFTRKHDAERLRRRIVELISNWIIGYGHEAGGLRKTIQTQFKEKFFILTTKEMKKNTV
jgi:hypothetical protein